MTERHRFPHIPLLADVIAAHRQPEASQPEVQAAVDQFILAYRPTLERYALQYADKHGMGTDSVSDLAQEATAKVYAFLLSPDVQPTELSTDSLPPLLRRLASAAFAEYTAHAHGIGGMSLASIALMESAVAEVNEAKPEDAEFPMAMEIFPIIAAQRLQSHAQLSLSVEDRKTVLGILSSWYDYDKRAQTRAQLHSYFPSLRMGELYRITRQAAATARKLKQTFDLVNTESWETMSEDVPDSAVSREELDELMLGYQALGFLEESMQKPHVHFKVRQAIAQLLAPGEIDFKEAAELAGVETARLRTGLSRVIERMKRRYFPEE